MDALQTFATGDTDYIAKHNSNNGTIEDAVNALESTRQLTSQKGTANGYASLDANGAVPASQLPSVLTVYDMLAYHPNAPGNAAILVRLVIPRGVSLPAGLTGSYVNARVGATASTTLTIKRNGSSVGTINFGAGATAATFTFASVVSLVAGDILTVENQATADATLADISIALAGTRTS